MNPVAQLVVAGEHVSGAARYSLAALQQAHVPFDSVQVRSPLPGGVRQVVRFLLTTVPSWVQIAGVLIGMIVAFAILFFLIRHRKIIIDWIVSRSTAVKVALAAIAVVIIAGVAGAGTVTWNYTQHSNDFCTGCHVMDRAVDRMRNGTSKHAKLSCHSCHQQPLSASISQLYVWVSERPERIEKHANVPNNVCETCHMTQDTARWQRIAATAGHRVHLESDSSALKNVKCVTCHGRELHRFEPAKATCGQQGCHDQNKTKIVLGKMAGQTVRHCTSCHQFTADVPALATTDSARGTLVPGASKCLGCHQMRQRLAEFDVRKDPHGGKCGMCHNPHKQEKPSDAARTCTNAGCHETWREEPFHVNAAHRKVGSQCLTCHLPHSARVDASDCAGCHSQVRDRGKLKPPLPFDTTQALKRSDASVKKNGIASVIPTGIRLALANFTELRASSSAEAVRSALGAPQPPSFHFGVSPPPPRAAAPDSFPHSRHEKFACLVCHETRAGRGRLTFERPRGCLICHHQAPAQSKCESCHQKSEYAAARLANATVTVPGHQPRTRAVEFRHASHVSRACVDCHTTAVTLAPAASKATCSDCHSDHHAAGRSCVTCHASVQPRAAHTMDVAHQRCDACHTAATVASLTPTRSFCSTCHANKATDHYPQKECTSCHFLADPAEYRSRLMTRGRE